MNYQQNKKIIQQGAEAIISLDKDKILKNRIKKSYRIPVLDEKIRKLRTRNEAKLMKIALTKIPVPKIINENEKTGKILMEYIKGKRLSNFLDKFSLNEQKSIARNIGKKMFLLHELGIAHGDLTTSNLIYVSLKNKKPKKDFKIYLIDFGLAFRTTKYEDKAVDFHLLKQALEAKHFKNFDILFKKVLEGYSLKNKTESEKVFQQLKKVEKRGRYKH
ncbi:MAG: KEOPS complex kinase/ATPase Bud32 [Nanoarchaeota archaeon]